MIQTDAELQQCLEQMERMYRVLARFRAEIAPINSANYRLMAEGPLEEIRRLQRDIDSYLDLGEPVVAGSSQE